MRTRGDVCREQTLCLKQPWHGDQLVTGYLAMWSGFFKVILDIAFETQENVLRVTEELLSTEVLSSVVMIPEVHKGHDSVRRFKTSSIKSSSPHRNLFGGWHFDSETFSLLSLSYLSLPRCENGSV